MKKTIDPKKLLANIPEEDKLPKRRSELSQLYFRLLNKMHRIDLMMGQSHGSIKAPLKSSTGDSKELEREFYKNECTSFIRTLKTYAQLHDIYTSLSQEEEE